MPSSSESADTPCHILIVLYPMSPGVIPLIKPDLSAADVSFRFTLPCDKSHHGQPVIDNKGRSVATPNSSRSVKELPQDETPSIPLFWDEGDLRLS